MGVGHYIFLTHPIFFIRTDLSYSPERSPTSILSFTYLSIDAKALVFSHKYHAIPQNFYLFSLTLHPKIFGINL